MGWLKRTYQHIADFADQFSENNTFSLAAALAFYAALSIAPLLVLFISIAAQVSPHLQEDFVAEANSLIGDRAGAALSLIMDAAKERADLKGFSGIFGFITLAVSASAVFAELKNSLNHILQDSQTAPLPGAKHNPIFVFVRDRILNIGFALSFLFILMVSLILSSVIHFYASLGYEMWAEPLNWIFSLALQFLLFTLLYRYVPSRRENWGQSALSGGITALLFLIGKEIVGLYIGRSAVASAYGAAGSVIVLLIWIYYSALIVFSGAQLSSLILKGRRPHV
jgi:membrane protein